MGIGSALKQFHADNLGKSTLIIVAIVFGGLTYLIYQTIDGIVAEPAKAKSEQVEKTDKGETGGEAAPAPSATPTTASTAPASAPAAGTSAPGSLLPGAVSSPEASR